MNLFWFLLKTCELGVSCSSDLVGVRDMAMCSTALLVSLHCCNIANTSVGSLFKEHVTNSTRASGSGCHEGEAGAKEGNKAIKGAVFDACQHVCAYHVHLKL